MIVLCHNDCVLANNYIAEWAGDSAMIWCYHPSLRRLVLRLFSRAESANIVESLIIVCTGCKSIKAKFSWDIGNLHLSMRQESNPHLSESAICIEDNPGEFLLMCNSFVLLKGNVDIPNDFINAVIGLNSH